MTNILPDYSLWSHPQFSACLFNVPEILEIAGLELFHSSRDESVICNGRVLLQVTHTILCAVLLFVRRFWLELSWLASTASGEVSVRPRDEADMAEVLALLVLFWKLKCSVLLGCWHAVRMCPRALVETLAGNTSRRRLCRRGWS